MKRIKLIATLFTLTAFAFSCDEGGDLDPGGTATQDFAGDWYITGYLDDGTIAFGGDYELFSTYNAASNDENFWIDDHESFFEIKTKVQANLSNLTFAGLPNSPELYTDGTVTVSNGQIIKNGALSAAGHVVDSIYFEAEFDWDPGVVYVFGGHKRTGFLEDENPAHH